MRLEEKVAERAFDLAKGKGKRIPRNRNHCKGGWKYGNRYFSITAIYLINCISLKFGVIIISE